jgi:hypothetical protein
MHSDTRVSLILCDFKCSADELSAQIGLEPTFVWAKGKATNRIATWITYDTNGWELSSNMPKSCPLEEHVDAILKMVDVRAEAIHALSNQCQVQRAVFGHSGVIVQRSVLRVVS